MCNKSFSFVLVAILVVAAAVNFAPSAIAQEAITLKEFPGELTAAPVDKTAEAVKELGKKMEQWRTAEAKADADKAKADADKAKADADKAKADADKAKADADKAKAKAEEIPWYLSWKMMGLAFCVVILAGIAIFLKRNSAGHDDRHDTGGHGPVHATIAILLLVAVAGTVQAAPCNIPAGQPFAVTSLSVLPYLANADAPRRVMIMPGQTRVFKITGCGFGWDANQVIVGFTGGPAVNLVSVENTEVIFKVTPEASFQAPVYLNMALRVKGNLLRTPMILEVQPPQAYAALQAVERHGVGTPSRPAPMVDNAARNAATVAARNAASASQSADAAKNGLITMATKFDQLFGTDGKGGVVGSEVVSLRKDVEALKKFADTTDGELFYKDGSSRIDDLADRLKALEEKGTAPSAFDPGIAEIRIELARLNVEIDAIKGVTVGSLHRGTIGQKSGLDKSIEKPTKKGRGGPVGRRVQ